MAPKDERQPARLRAHDLDDLSVIGALVQDSLVPAQDIQYLPDEKCFVLALNRFRWETAEAGPPFERVHAGLRFDRVEQVRYRGIDRSDDQQFYDLLAVAYDRPDGAADGAGHVLLQFADAAAIRLTVSGLDCWLQDFGDPWPSPNRPDHKD